MDFLQGKERGWAEARKGKKRHRGLSDLAEYQGSDSGTQPVSTDLQGSAETGGLCCLSQNQRMHWIGVDL